MIPYFVRDGKISFWHDLNGGSCFGSYPAPTLWVKNIDLKELMDALGVTGIEDLSYALRRLPGRSDIERLKDFCDKRHLNYDFVEEEAWQE